MALGIGRKEASSHSEASTGPFVPQNDDHRERVLTAQELLHRHGLPAAELFELEQREDREPSAAGTSTHERGQLAAREHEDIAALRRDRCIAEFDGKQVRKRLRKQYKPRRDFDVEKLSEFISATGGDHPEGRRGFLNRVGTVFYKDDFVDCFLDPKSGEPADLVVQAVKTTITASDLGKSPSSWTRGNIRGSVPAAVRLAHWASRAGINKAESVIRVIIVALPLQILLGFPGARPPWENDFDPSYDPYPGFHWKLAKHSVNALDARPGDRRRYEKPQQLSTSHRLDRPRRLMVLKGEEWVLEDNPQSDLQYIFISYAWHSFKSDPEKVSKMAQYACNEENVQAYFHDAVCNASQDEEDLLTADVYRMCDVIRGAKFVALLLPDDDPEHKLAWANRMWTLPEGLLTPAHLRICTWQQDAPPVIVHRTRVELTSEFWTQTDDDGENSARTLAEHYTGVVPLSRLELFQVAISAFRIRKTGNDWTGADLGYALMGLVRFRIDPDPTDDLFQVIARLSLVNDNDRLIERLISMFPHNLESLEDPDERDILRSFAEKDRYETYCFDIEAKCRVVGVADERGSVILSDCRAVPIHWNKFPQVVFKRKQMFKHRLAELVVRSGVWWLATACLLAIAYAALFIAFDEVIDEANDIIDDIPPVETESISDDYRKPMWGAIVFFAGMSALLSLLAPAIVRSLFGGPMLQTAPYLVGFEGTMPKKELEKKIFGSSIDVLRYDPSTAHSGSRSRYLRMGKEPAWITESEAPAPSPGHRWFTLVDTGNLTITVFEARRPPTVALITGADGGMLRAVLCSWRFVDDCHYRETVIRVPSNSWTLCKPAGWIKLCLNSQGDLLDPLNRPRNRLAGAKWKQAASTEKEVQADPPPVPPKSSHRSDESTGQEGHRFGKLEGQIVVQSRGT